MIERGVLPAEPIAGWRHRLAGVLWPRSLRPRLALPFVGLTVLVLIILYVVIGQRAQQLYIDRLSVELKNQAIVTADSVGRVTATGGAGDVAASAPESASRRTRD